MATVKFLGIVEEQPDEPWTIHMTPKSAAEPEQPESSRDETHPVSPPDDPEKEA